MSKYFIKPILLSLFLLVATIPGMILSSRNYVDSFDYFRLVRVNASASTGYIPEISLTTSASRRLRLGHELQIALISKFTGVDGEKLLTFPLGSILLPLLYFSLSWSFSRNFYASLFMAVFVGYQHSRLTTQYSTMMYTFAHSLVYVFLLASKLWLKNKQSSVLIVILPLFLASFVTYHTTSIWIITYILFLSGLIMMVNWFLNRNNVPIQKPIKGLPNYAIAFLVLYVIFDRIIFQALARIVNDQVLTTGAYNTLLNQLSDLFEFNQRLVPLSEFQVTNITHPIAGYASIFILLFICVPPLMYLGQQSTKIILKKSDNHIFEPKTIALYSLLFVCLIHFSIYSLYGTLSFRAVQVLLPFGTLISLVLLFPFKPTLVTSYCSLLALVSILGFTFFQTNIPATTTSYSHQKTALIIGENKAVTTDLETYGKLVVGKSKKDSFVFPKLSPLTSSNYSNLIDSKLGSVPHQLWILNMNDDIQRLTSLDWSYFEPFSKYTKEVKRNQNFNLVIDSGDLNVLLNN